MKHKKANAVEYIFQDAKRKVIEKLNDDAITDDEKELYTSLLKTVNKVLISNDDRFDDDLDIKKEEKNLMS